MKKKGVGLCKGLQLLALKQIKLSIIIPYQVHQLGGRNSRDSVRSLMFCTSLTLFGSGDNR